MPNPNSATITINANLTPSPTSQPLAANGTIYFNAAVACTVTFDPNPAGFPSPISLSVNRNGPYSPTGTGTSYYGVSASSGAKAPAKVAARGRVGTNPNDIVVG